MKLHSMLHPCGVSREKTKGTHLRPFCFEAGRPAELVIAAFEM